MTGTVLMSRPRSKRPGRDLFSCSVTDWKFLHELGMTFGWQPHGTTYQLPHASKIVTTALHDYEPGDAADRKEVDRDDAVEWARALESAKRSPHFAAMLEARVASQAANAGVSVASLTGLIDEFAEYAFGGAFSFVKGDEATQSDR
jgi:hypothetical protein